MKEATIFLFPDRKKWKSNRKESEEMRRSKIADYAKVGEPIEV